MFSWPHSLDYNNQSIDNETGVSSDMKNDGQKRRIPHMGSAWRRIRSFLSTITSYILGTDDRSDYLLTSLPTEVITHVLRYLPLIDRKNVRLTCKLLNHCSKHVSITKLEKFCFPPTDSCVCEILSRTDSAVLNLVFRSTLDDIPVDVWRTCGDRIRGLHFCDPLGNRVLLDILLHCDGLQSIGFGLYSLDLLIVLNDLIELNITRTGVRSLVLSRLGSDDLLRAFFTVFPNLEHLGAIFEDLELETKCLKPFMRLRSLMYEVSSPSLVRTYWSEDQIAPEFPKRLSKFRTDPSDSNLCPVATESFLLRFLAVQNELQVLRLLVPWRCEYRGKEVVFHVLRSCPKLREFRFSATRMHLETSDEVSEFIALISNLRCLILGSLPRIPDGSSLPSTKFMLRMLAVHSDNGHNQLLLHILKHSPEMRHLYIGGNLWETQSSPAFEYVSDLRTLILEEQLVEAQSHDWCTGRLQKSKFLAIWFSLLHYQGKLKNHPDYDRILIDQLHDVLWSMAALETVFLPMRILPKRGRKFIKLFQNFENLHHLTCDHAESGCLERLFRSCPNLKYITEFRDLRTWSFDSSAKQIIISDWFPDLVKCQRQFLPFTYFA